jgi:micrococcal nuclease
MLRRIARRTIWLLILAALAFWVYRGHVPRRLPRTLPGRSARTVPRWPAHVRVPVGPKDVWVDDGDTIKITWEDAPRETVRLLGIDAPEIRHSRNPGSLDQPYGRESLEFARRRILGAGRLELLRAQHTDRYRRTLGYVFVDGMNYSVLAIENHMAESTIDRFGDSGFPREAAEVAAAARRAGPIPFESPVKFRDRTRISPAEPASPPTLPASQLPAAPDPG